MQRRVQGSDTKQVALTLFCHIVLILGEPLQRRLLVAVVKSRHDAGFGTWKKSSCTTSHETSISMEELLWFDATARLSSTEEFLLGAAHLLFPNEGAAEGDLLNQVKMTKSTALAQYPIVLPALESTLRYLCSAVPACCLSCWRFVTIRFEVCCWSPTSTTWLRDSPRHP